MPTDGKGDGGLREAQDKRGLPPKPCPLCASTNLEWVTNGDPARWKRQMVKCSDCGLRFDDDDALAKWNARAPFALTEAAKPGGKLREALTAMIGEGPGVQDEQGGCNYCGGHKPGDPWTVRDKDHDPDCSWLRGKVALTAPPREEEGDQQAAENEAYDIGKRDGFSEAIQQVDLETGGDGEYRASTDPLRHVPDAAAMMTRIRERFADRPASPPTAVKDALDGAKLIEAGTGWVKVHGLKDAAKLRAALVDLAEVEGGRS